jgi:molybdenum cofactor cytidylyltransferase
MSPSSNRIGAVILAADRSSRFGQPKQLIRFRGKILARRIIDAACEAGCSPVVVVLKSEDENLHREFDRAGVVTVQNQQWQRGIGGSIRCGIQGLINSSPDVEATVLLVCDQPAVDAGVIERLIALHETTAKSIVASSDADTLGVPALFSRSVFAELLSLDDNAGAKSIVLRSRERVASLSFPEGQIDIDTWKDWKKLDCGALHVSSNPLATSEKKIEQASRSTGSTVKAAATHTETAHPDLTTPASPEQAPVENVDRGNQS